MKSIVLTKTIIYRGRETPIEKMHKNSDKKITVKCPVCQETRDMYLKSYFLTNHTICHTCGLKQRRKDLQVGSVYNGWVILEKSKIPGLSLCKCNCGSIREVSNHTLVNGTSKSCGCFSIQLLKNRRKQPIIGSKFGRLEVISRSNLPNYSICKCICGSIGEFLNSNLRSKNTQSCGCLQREIFKSNHFQRSGNDHPNWKDGISSIRERLMQTEKYKEWRNAVFLRDNFICYSCHQKGEELNAHHIQAYSQSPDLCVDIDNGVTLCKKCHSLFHKYFGRKNINLLHLEIYDRITNYCDENSLNNSLLRFL